jgi:hypothetical protein
VIDTTYPVSEGPKGLKQALDRIAKEAEQAVESGYSFIVLSDRAFGPSRVPVSALLAGGRVHHQLIQVLTASLPSGCVLLNLECRIAPLPSGCVLHGLECRIIKRRVISAETSADPYLGFGS